MGGLFDISAIAGELLAIFYIVAFVACCVQITNGCYKAQQGATHVGYEGIIRASITMASGLIVGSLATLFKLNDAIVQPNFSALPQELVDAMSYALGLLILITFIFGIVGIFSGIDRARSGDSEAGKQSILWGALAMSCTLILGGIIAIIGLPTSVALQPKF